MKIILGDLAIKLDYKLYSVLQNVQITICINNFRFRQNFLFLMLSQRGQWFIGIRVSSFYSVGVLVWWCNICFSEGLVSSWLVKFPRRFFACKIKRSYQLKSVYLILIHQKYDRFYLFAKFDTSLCVFFVLNGKNNCFWSRCL